MIIDKNNFKNFKYFFLLLLIFLSFHRSPFIFLNGRFLAEEATQHFIFALQNNFFQNLIYYDELAGYFNLIPNLFTWISANLKIQYAPLATVYGSLIFIILLPYLCLFRESNFLNSEIKKILASLILFFSPPFVPEIWLNTINSQVYLCLIAILILFMINLTQKQKIINHILIFFGGLSGIYTCALLPFFFIKHFFDKIKYNFINLVILLFTNTLQLIIILRSKINDTLIYSDYDFRFDLDLLVNIFYNFIAKAIMARQLVHLIWDKLGFLINQNYYLLLLVFLILILMIISINFKSLANFCKKDQVFLYLSGIFIVISLVVIFGSLDNQVSGRYAVIPGSLLLLIYLHLFSIAKKLYLKIFFLVLVCTSLITGLYEFRPPTINVKHQYLKLLDCLNCPIWSEEIQKWQSDKSYIIGVWPYPRKKLILGNISID